MYFASEFAFIGEQANVIQMKDQEVDIALQNQSIQTGQAPNLQNQAAGQAAKFEQLQKPQISYLSTQSSLQNPSSNFGQPQFQNLSQFQNQQLNNMQNQTFGFPIQQQQFYKPQQEVIHKQEVDTNVLSINMSILQKEAQELTGNLTSCSYCKVFLNSYSKVEESQTWSCEFCGTQNVLQEVIKPQQELFTYVIENTQGEQLNDISIIFVIDISGSMSYSYQSQSQYSPLECVKTAISQQLQSLATNYPNRYVGLITFSDEVSLIGDGTQEPFIAKGQELYNSEWLISSVRDGHKRWMGKQISFCYEDLNSKVKKIQTQGSTALGPALLMAIELGSQGRSGSKIIICTDGIANKGIGDLGVNDNFYQYCGNSAQEKGLEISIICIEGQECKLDKLLPLVEQTQGDLTKVDPTLIQANVSNILKNPIIATNVKLTLTLHKQVKFRNEVNLELDGSKVSKKIGNANGNTLVAFEYQRKQNY